MITREALMVLAVVAFLFSFATAETTEVTDSTGYEDVVVMKNGATIKGRILEVEAGKKVVIEREDGYVMEVPHKRIAVITDGDGMEHDKKEYFATHEKETAPSGWQNTYIVGPSIGGGGVSYAFKGIIGDDISDRIWLGATIGSQGLSNGSVWAVGLDIRYRLNPLGSISPFIYANPEGVGASVDGLKKEDKSAVGGMKAELGVGAVVGSHGAMQLTARLGYGMLWADARLEDPAADDSVRSHGSLLIMFGWQLRL